MHKKDETTQTYLGIIFFQLIQLDWKWERRSILKKLTKTTFTFHFQHPNYLKDLFPQISDVICVFYDKFNLEKWTAWDCFRVARQKIIIL